MRALDWLCLYLAIGTVIGLVMVPVALLGKRRDAFSDSLLDTLHPQRKSRWYRFRERVLVPLVLILAMAIGWPLLGPVAIHDMIRGRRASSGTIKQQPEMLAKDLVKSLSIPEVEAEGQIVDPLRAVPDLPFGHLNEAWKAFLKKRAEGEVLWSYRSQCEEEFGGAVEHSGYVWVRARRPGAHFRTYYRQIRED